MTREPRSLVNPRGATANDRRARAAVDVLASPDSDPDSTTIGFHTRWCTHLHLLFEIDDGGAGTDGCDWELWCYDSVSEQWYLDTRPGSSGTVTLAPADADYPVYGNIVELAGTVERVFVKLDNATGAAWGAGDGVNVWLSGVGDGTV